MPPTTTPHAPPPMRDLRTIARRAMVERGLLPEFSAEALAEAAAFTGPAEAPARDLRELLWCSIDNDDSRDLDQLSVSREIAGGQVAILVAVADVDALVKKGSPLDQHARTNTTSVYTAAAIFPMLPERLSTDLTSLNAGGDRLAVVIELVVNGDGSIGDSEVYQALVRNKAKLAYNGVAAWLEGHAEAPAALASVPGMEAQLRTQDRAAQALRTRRFEQGALTLETLEARAVFEGSTLSDLVPEGRNRAKDLIEDFMIAANGVTARFLDARGFPSLRRVLRSPERWAKIVSLAAGVGETLPDAPSNAALEAFLIKRRDASPDHFADLSLSVVKLLGRGEYVVDLPKQEAPGHFGLALRDYTHATAPNRRYPDLITHRLVKAALANRASPYAAAELDTLAQHCTAQEDAAIKVERRVRKSAAALLLASRVGQPFDAIVTGAGPKGTWVRIAHPAAEGKLVRGHGLDALDVGDRIRVVLVHTDVEQGFVDFART